MWNIVKSWEEVLISKYKLPPISYTNKDFKKLIKHIESCNEGHILCDSKNISTIISLCLVIKHFSIIKRKLVICKINDQNLTILTQLKLNPFIEITSEFNQFFYIFYFNETKNLNNVIIHPFGDTLNDGQSTRPYDETEFSRPLFKSDAFSKTAFGSSSLAYNDILYLRTLFSKFPKVKSVHLLIYAMDPGQQVYQLTEILKHTHSNCKKEITIVAPFLTYDYSQLEAADIKINAIKNDWNDHEKNYSLSIPIDFVIFDSSNFNLFLAPHLKYFFTFNQRIDFICFNHYFKIHHFESHSDQFIRAYEYRFVKDLLELSKFITDSKNVFKPLEIKINATELPLPNHNFLIPAASKCYAVGIQ